MWQHTIKAWIGDFLIFMKQKQLSQAKQICYDRYNKKEYFVEMKMIMLLSEKQIIMQLATKKNLWNEAHYTLFG